MPGNNFACHTGITAMLCGREMSGILLSTHRLSSTKTVSLKHPLITFTGQQSPVISCNCPLGSGHYIPLTIDGQTLSSILFTGL